MEVIDTDLFAHTLAAKIRSEFNAALARGANVYMAAENIVQENVQHIHDPDLGPVILYALAALQLQHGVVSSRIRKRVLTMINSGDGLERWRGAAPEVYAARNKVEQELRAKLIEIG